VNSQEVVHCGRTRVSIRLDPVRPECQTTSVSPGDRLNGHSNARLIACPVKRFIPVLVPPYEPDQPTLYGHFVRSEYPRFVGWVFRLKRNATAFLAKAV